MEQSEEPCSYQVEVPSGEVLCRNRIQLRMRSPNSPQAPQADNLSENENPDSQESGPQVSE